MAIDTHISTDISPLTPASERAIHTARAYAAISASSGLAPFSVRRRAVGPTDVRIRILYCGVCHSDLHQVRNEWQNTMPTQYPLVSSGVSKPSARA